ncbi:hypothetical protein M0813_24094 [Anaeramoeba flamelloides]|uniref:Uncharacterized protein n=1 Tax=Anaeramoeba flamelloides TaxID=1746091 RepID=A0ABQ8Y6E9_9EUKA|nr:hypothetical protein M0813_24094 [Anaeramoeba flamelloides]
MNNPQPLNSSKVVVGPFEYGKSTLLDILSSYSQKSIHQSSFTFYVPVEELKFDHVTIKKRWIWNGEEFEYSPHSDVVAILLHSSRYVPPKNSKIVHKSIIRYNTINNRSVEEQYGTKKLELVGVLASFKFLDKEVNKFSMKRKNGIRSRYSTKSIRPIVFAEEVQIVPTKNEIPTKFVFPNNRHPSTKKNPVFNKQKFVKNNSSTSNKQKNKKLNQKEVTENEKDQKKKITKTKTKKIKNQKKTTEIKANPNYNTKRNSNAETTLGIGPDPNTHTVGNTTINNSKSTSGSNNLGNRKLLQNSLKFQVNNAQLSQNQNQSQNPNPNFNVYANFNKQNLNNQIPSQTMGLNSTLNNQNNFNFINQPFNENFLFNPLLYLNDLQSNRHSEKQIFSPQFNQLSKNFQIPNPLNEFDRKRNNFNSHLNQVHPNYTTNHQQQQQLNNLQPNYLLNQQHNQREEKKIQMPNILQNQKNDGLFQLGNLSENLIKNHSHTNNNTEANNTTGINNDKNNMKPKIETEKILDHKTNPKRKLNNTIGMFKSDSQKLNITTNPINDFMLTQNDSHYNLHSDKNINNKKNFLHFSKLNKKEINLTTPNRNQAETTLSNETIGFSLSNDPCLAYSSDIILQHGISDPNKSLDKFSKIVLYLETQSKRYEFSLKNNQMFRLSEVLKPHTYPKRRLLNTKNVPMQKKLIIILKENLKFDQIKWCSNWVLFDDLLVTATKFFYCNRIIPLEFENIN